MKIDGKESFDVQFDFVGDIYFKFYGNAAHIQLNLIRKFENKLYLREIYIRVNSFSSEPVKEFTYAFIQLFKSQILFLQISGT